MAFTTLGGGATAPPFNGNTTTPAPYDLLELSNGNPATWIPICTSCQTVTYTAGDYVPGGQNVFSLMVIPKTNVSATNLLVETVGWINNTQFYLYIECPAPLRSFSGVSGTALCSIPTEEYYFAGFVAGPNNSPTPINNPYPEQNNPVFTDPYGQNVFSPGAGNATVISMDNGNVITVEDGIVISTTNPPTPCT